MKKKKWILLALSALLLYGCMLLPAYAEGESAASQHKAAESEAISAVQRDKTENYLYGAVAWGVIGGVLLLTGLVLLSRRRSRNNHVTSGQYYAIQRKNRNRPQRLLNEKYYDGLHRSNRKKE